MLINKLKEGDKIWKVEIRPNNIYPTLSEGSITLFSLCENGRTGLARLCATFPDLEEFDGYFNYNTENEFKELEQLIYRQKEYFKLFFEKENAIKDIQKFLKEWIDNHCSKMAQLEEQLMEAMKLYHQFGGDLL